MSDALEAGGGLVAAGLAAHAVEGAGGAPHGPAGGAGAAGHGAHACHNCGTALTGAYCHACGQPAHLHRSLLHLVEEFLHGLLHFDAKGWRTLPQLVARPGQLTRRYIDGERVRHVSPLALFLFMVFLLFFVVSLTSGAPEVKAGGTPADRAALVDDLKEAQAEVVRADAEVTHAKVHGGDVAAAQAEVDDARADERASRLALEAFDASARAAEAASAAAQPASTASSTDFTYHVGQGGWAAALSAIDIDTGSARLDNALRRAAASPDFTVYKLKNAASKFSFLLVPISLPFLWLMFVGRRGVAMYDHAVFVLYSLSFMSLLFVAAALLTALGLGGLAFWLVVVGAPVHMHLQLRGTYGLGGWAAGWRTVAVLAASLAVFVMYLGFILYVTMG